MANGDNVLPHRIYIYIYGFVMVNTCIRVVRDDFFRFEHSEC